MDNIVCGRCSVSQIIQFGNLVYLSNKNMIKFSDCIEIDAPHTHTIFSNFHVHLYAIPISMYENDRILLNI